MILYFQQNWDGIISITFALKLPKKTNKHIVLRQKEVQLFTIPIENQKAKLFFYV